MGVWRRFLIFLGPLGLGGLSLYFSLRFQFPWLYLLGAWAFVGLVLFYFLYAGPQAEKADWLRARLKKEIAEHHRLDEEKRRVAGTLKDHQRQLADAQEIAHVGSWEWNLFADHLSCSDELYRIFGIDPSGDPNQEGHRSMRALIQKCYERSQATGFEQRIAQPDGSERILYIRGGVIHDEEFGGVRVVGIAQDITERKIAEEALEKQRVENQIIFDSVPAMIWYKDRFNTILRVNRRAADSIGLPVERVEGRSTYDLYPLEAEKYHRDDLDVIHSGLPKLGIEEPYRLPTGEVRWVRTDKLPYLNVQGETMGVLVFAVDITEMKRAEDNLKKSREGLRNLAARLESVREQERTRIACDLHDQLGQNLTALKLDFSAFAEKIMGGKIVDPEEAQEKKREVLDSIDLTLKSVRKISADLRPGILDDLGLEAAIEWEAQELGRRTGMVCDISIKNPMPLNPAEKTGVYRIFQEILTNVARHSEATEVAIRIGGNSREFCMEVQDNGVGIAPEKISDPKSLGILGMLERARLLNGDLSLSVPAGGGTRVRLVIPWTEERGRS